MALKYSFKLIFLKFIFESVINTPLQASNSVYGKENCSKCNNFTGSIIQWQRGLVVCVFFKHFSLFSFRLFYHIFSLSLPSLYPRCWPFLASRGFCDNVFLVGQNKRYKGRSYGIIKLFKITTEHCNSHL